MNIEDLNPDLFYDAQLMQDALCWRLEAINNEVRTEYYTDKKKAVDKTQDQFGYTEILRGILSDIEFNYKIGNAYETDSDLDIVSGTVNKALQSARSTYYKGKQMSGVINTVGSMAGNGLGVVGKMAESVGGAASGTMDWGLDLGNKLVGNASGNLGLKGFNKGVDLVNSKFISAFEHAKFWGGSNVDIELPTLEVTLFDNDDKESLMERLTKLHGYFMQDVTQVQKLDNGNLVEGSGIWGLMRAPNDYRPNFDQDNLDDPEFQGTFRLYLGTRYLIKNLVCTSFDVTLSQYKRLNPAGNSDKTPSPAYAQIKITLDLASFVTKKTLEKCFLSS